MKYIANLLVAIHNVASAEALVLGMKAGLPPQLISIRSGSAPAIRRVRIARADDGERPLRRPDDEGVDLAEGHGRDRWLRAGASARRSRLFPRRCRFMRRLDRPVMVSKTLQPLARCLRRWPGSSGAGAGVHGGRKLEQVRLIFKAPSFPSARPRAGGYRPVKSERARSYFPPSPSRDRAGNSARCRLGAEPVSRSPAR